MNSTSITRDRRSSFSQATRYSENVKSAFTPPILDLSLALLLMLGVDRRKQPYFTTLFHLILELVSYLCGLWRSRWRRYKPADLGTLPARSTLSATFIPQNTPARRLIIVSFVMTQGSELVTEVLIAAVVETLLFGVTCTLFVASTSVSLNRFVKAQPLLQRASSGSNSSRGSVLQSYFCRPLNIGPVVLVICAMVVRASCFPEIVTSD